MIDKLNIGVFFLQSDLFMVRLKLIFQLLVQRIKLNMSSIIKTVEVKQPEKYLQNKDLIIISDLNYRLYCLNSDTQCSLMTKTSSDLSESIFEIQSADVDFFSQNKSCKHFILYGEKVYLQNYLSKKYLGCYSLHGKDQFYLSTQPTNQSLITLIPFELKQNYYRKRIALNQAIKLISNSSKQIKIELSLNKYGQKLGVINWNNEQGSLLKIQKISSFIKRIKDLDTISVYLLSCVEDLTIMTIYHQQQRVSRIIFSYQVNYIMSYLNFEYAKETITYNEEYIKYNQPFFIKFRINGCYLGISDFQDIILCSVTQESCEFILEQYNTKALTELTPFRIKHRLSGKYFSLCNGQVKLQNRFTIGNLFYLKRVSHLQIINSLLYTTIYYHLETLFKQKQFYSFRYEIHALIAQIIKIVFKNAFNYDSYFGMNFSSHLLVDKNNQILLTQIGFFQLFLNKILEIIPIISRYHLENRTFQDEFISKTMIILVGMCHSHTDNTNILKRYLMIFMQNIFNQPGLLQGLYFLCQNDVITDQFEKEYSLSKDQKITPISYLIRSIIKQNHLTINFKIKTLILLKKILFSQLGIKYKLVQYQLIEALKKGNLNNIILKIKIIDDEIFIQDLKQQFQLSQIIQKKNKFGQYLIILEKQFDFLCALFKDTSQEDKLYFRTIISEKSALHYIKMKLNPEDKNIFLKIIDEVYLTSLPKQVNNIVSIQGKKLFCSKHWPEVLFQIKDDFFSAVKYILKHQLYDQSLYLYLRVFRHFYHILIVDQIQWEQFHGLIQVYLCDNFQQITEMETFIPLCKQILSFYQYTTQIRIDNRCNFILNKIIKQVTLRSKDHNLAEQEIEKLFYEIQLKESQITYKFITKLMNYSIIKKGLYYESSKVLNFINNQQYATIKKLTQVIIIYNQELNEVVNNIYNLQQKLQQLLFDQLKIEGQGIKTKITNQIIKTLQEVNSYFFWEYQNTNDRYFFLIQNIIRQIGIFSTYIQLLTIQKKIISLQKYQYFETLSIIIDFFELFIRQNDTNINLFISNFNSIKWIFQKPDFGQAKLMYLIILNGSLEQIKIKQFVSFSLKMIKKSQMPSFYSIACLIGLIKSDIISSKIVIQQLSNKLITQPSLLDILWMKKDNLFIVQQQKFQQPQYCPYFHFYLFCVVKLLLLLIQNNSKRQILIDIYRERININLIFELLFHKDLYDSVAFSAFGTIFVKQQIISYFMQIQQQKIPQMHQKQVLQLKKMAFNLLTRLLSLEFYQSPEKPEIIGKYQSIYNDSIKIKNNYQKGIDSRIHIHYFLICILYPFTLNICFRLTQIINLNYIKEQLNQLYYKCYRKIKQLLTVSQTTKFEFYKYEGQYKNSINKIQQIINYKISLDKIQQLQILCDDKFEILTSRQKLYKDSKIHNIIDNMEAALESKNTLCIGIYRAILILVYSPNIKQNIKDKHDKVSGIQSSIDISTIISTITEASLQNSITYCSDIIQELTLFFHHPKFIQNLTAKVQRELIKLIQQLLQRNQEKSKPNFDILFIIFCNSLMNSLILSEKHIFPNIIRDIFWNTTKSKQQLTKKIRVFITTQICKEKNMYDRKQYQKQIQYYVNNSDHLNIVGQKITIRIEQILKFILLLIKFKNEEDEFSNTIIHILQLVRSYIQFMKHFNMKYVPKQLFGKLNLCLQIIQHTALTNPDKVSYLLEEGIYHQQFNMILELDDTYQTSKETVLQSEKEYLNNVIYTIENTQWLTTLSQLCANSEKVYGDKITYEWGNFPFQNMSCLYGPLKRNLVLILKTFQIKNTPQCQQFIKKIKLQTINQTISIIYYKYFQLYNSYDVKPKVRFTDNRLQLLCDTLCFQNGVDLTSLKIYRDSLYGKKDLEEKYVRSISKNKSNKIVPITQFQIREDDQFEVRMTKIYIFFLSKTGRVQLLLNRQLLSIDFWIPPECFMFRQIYKRRFKNINFVSTQLKIDSIRDNCCKFHIIYQSYLSFMKNYLSFKIINRLQRAVILIKIINLLLIYAATVVLLTDNNDDPETIRIQSTVAFTVLLIVNLTLAIIYFAAYCIKNAPVFVGKLTNSVRKMTGQQKLNQHGCWKFTIKLIAYLLQHKQFVYNLLFLLVMFCTFIEKVLIALFAIDLLVHIPKMNIIFRTVWRSKGQIFFTTLAFYLFSYYYAIITYRFFVTDKIQQFKNVCSDLGSCYTHVMVLNFRLVGGFAGYIYRLQHQRIKTNSFHFFDVFSDIYLILFFLILPSIIFAVLLNELSKTMRRSIENKNNLQFDCLICGLSRTIFNQTSQSSFKTHVTTQHNINHYYYYFHYISKKKPLERNIFQSEIILRKDINWLPIGYAQGFRQPNKNKI